MSLYFERWGFSARVSQRSRSAFRGEVEGFGGDRDRSKFFAGGKVTDFQMGYACQSGALQGLSLLRQMYNLENEPAIETPRGIGYPAVHATKPTCSAELQALTQTPCIDVTTPASRKAGSFFAAVARARRRRSRMDSNCATAVLLV